MQRIEVLDGRGWASPGSKSGNWMLFERDCEVLKNLKEFLDEEVGKWGDGSTVDTSGTISRGNDVVESESEHSLDCEGEKVLKSGSKIGSEGSLVITACGIAWASRDNSGGGDSLLEEIVR
jgi:hypothetical protein